MWKILSASCAGTSHQRSGQPCQDYAVACSLSGTTEVVLVAACADGAGSARYGEIGSRLACLKFTAEVSTELQTGLRVREISRDHVVRWHRATLQELETEAEVRRTAARELACTLLLTVI